MSAITRNLLPFAISRNRQETVTLVTIFPELQKNGSFNFFKEETQVLARVVSLTPNEIERLQVAGITIKKGVSISIVGELEKIPDSVITADGTTKKVVTFTADEGATILIADEPSLGNDGPSYQSGYAP